MQNVEMKPKVAIVVPNTLAALGLAGLIEKMMPGAEVCIYSNFKNFEASQAETFFHFFISSSILTSHAPFFLSRKRKTIVLVHGDEKGHLPDAFHSLNVFLPEEELTKAFVRMEQMAHGGSGHIPQAVRKAQEGGEQKSALTPRETEVLRLIVSGLINKEIASQLGVSLTTVISHRKNLTEKLNIKTVSGLTIYAVTHGIINAEDI